MSAGTLLLRVKTTVTDEAAFVERFASQIHAGGLFLQSRAPRAVGTVVRFEFLLADGTTTIFKGEGQVIWVRPYDADRPTRPHGMGIRYSILDEPSKGVLAQVEAYKKERGMRDEASFARAIHGEQDKTALSHAVAGSCTVAAEATADGIDGLEGLERMLGKDTLQNRVFDDTEVRPPDVVKTK